MTRPNIHAGIPCIMRCLCQTRFQTVEYMESSILWFDVPKKYDQKENFRNIFL